MKRVAGSVVSEGVVRGEAFVISTGEVHVRRGKIGQGQEDREVQRLERALVATRRDIEALKEKARSKLGEMTEVIDTYLAFLNDDREIVSPIRELIRSDHLDAPTAVSQHFSRVVQKLRQLPEPLPSRAPDLIDIERRVIGHLIGRRGGARLDRLPKKVVIIADDLSPTQTASLDRDRILGFATDMGGPASHTAILARHLGIPAVVGLGDVTQQVRQGDTVIIDGLEGQVIIDPDEETSRTYHLLQQRRSRITRRIRVSEGDLRTADGFQVTLQGNIDSGEGARDLKELGVQGVGLFRTEFLYLGREQPPDEETQTEHYRSLLEVMDPHPVCFRTMDFGADKFDDRVGSAHEPNPALGMRAIRISFRHQDLFETQLRAILRASPAGRGRIMFPLVTDVGEFRRARRILAGVMDELRSSAVPFDESIQVGAMVEIPATALGARNLLREADFISLGTNDLTQYTLAVDRTNPLVSNLFSSHHPAVLRLIRMAAEAAREAGKPISACGEMAGSGRYTPVLLGLGVSTLSVAAPRVLDVLESIPRLTLSRCRDLAEAMIQADDAAASEALLEAFLSRLPRRKPRRPA